MSSHDFTVGVYLLVFAVSLTMQVRASASRTIPSLTVVFRRVMRTRTGRVVVLSAWAWLGLHFFAG